MNSDIPIQLHTILSQNDEVLAADMDGEVVMMHLEMSEYYGLDAMASDIWEQLTEPTSVAKLCTALQQKYEVDRATCVSDVLAYLNEMNGYALLKITG
jgi:hypothetical protein